jgi:hypothetical protein
MAYNNDMIVLLPGRRDACYAVGFSNTWTSGYNEDPNFLNKNGK